MMGMFNSRSRGVILKSIAGVQLLALAVSGLAFFGIGGAQQHDSAAVAAPARAPVVAPQPAFDASVAPGMPLTPPVNPAPASPNLDVASAFGLPAMLPARMLNCSLGRVTNFDPNRDQSMSDYIYEGRHALKLFLPSIPARTSAPPDAMAPAEPVDPKTKVVSDPDGIAADATLRPFNRVVDLWPSRVEMTTPVNDIVSNVIVIAQIDQKQSTATIFMAHANDAVTYDLKRLYFGKCKIAVERS